MNHKNILLVDDDDDDQFIFIDALNEITNDIECRTAKNGLEALEQLKTISHPPSLIFLDLNMPLMNGFECLKEIKDQPRLKEIPVIIFTTSDNPSDERRAKELGVSVFFTKTSNFKLLKAKLDDILNTDFTKGRFN